MTKNLRCPSCGSEFSPVMDSGSGYMAWPTVVGFECDNYKCGAEWNIYGNVTVESALTTDPESVD